MVGSYCQDSLNVLEMGEAGSLGKEGEASRKEPCELLKSRVDVKLSQNSV
jgi:hypothetical protein